MYESHWQLAARPFENSADAQLYYPGEAHQGALLKLRYAIETRQAAALLTGGAGLGKSMLVRSLLERLPETYAPRVHLVFPQMPADQLLAYLAAQLTGHETGPETPPIQQSVRQIEAFLIANAREGRHAVVAIDEAQLLADGETLETLRLLLNFDYEGAGTLTLLLVGQPALLPALDRRPGLEERLGAKCLMRPLTADETAGYVTHRLQAAGAEREIFTADALDALHYASAGVPRRINRLADLALLIGYADGSQQITSEQVEAVSQELVTVTPE